MKYLLSIFLPSRGVSSGARVGSDNEPHRGHRAGKSFGERLSTTILSHSKHTSSRLL